MSKRRISTIAAGVVASALLLLSVSPLATAATGADGFLGLNTGASPNGHQLGTYKPTGYSQRAVCIDISTYGNLKDPPSSQTGAITNYDPAIAYMLYSYSQTGDENYAAALEYWVGLRINSNSTEIQNAWNQLASYNPTNFRNAQTALGDMTQHLASYGGPYTSDIGMTSSNRGWAGGITNVGPQPAGPGQWPYVPYISTDLTLVGPAVFDQSGTNTISGTTDGWGGLGATSTAWHATGVGTIAVNGTYHGLALTYTLYPAPSSSTQRMVTGASVGDLSVHDPVDATAITPTVTSHLQKQLGDGTWVDTTSVRVNEKVRDTVQVANGLANTTVNLDWKAETSAQPFSATNTVGTTIDSGTVPIVLDGNGAGSAVLPFTIPVDYSGHVGVDTFLHGSVANGVDDVDPPIFDNGESAPIQKWTPTVSSQLQKPGAAVDSNWVSADTFMAGDTVRDVIVIAGGAPNSPVLLDWAERTSDKAFSKTNLGTLLTGTKAATSGTGIAITLDANGAATYVLPVSTGTGAGYIGIDTYVHGLAQNADVDPPVWDANESGLVTLYVPKVTTQANAAALIAGTAMTDQLMVTGARPDTAFTCSATLYGPYAAQPVEQDVVPVDAVKVGTATCQGKTDADGNATVLTSVVNAPSTAGYFVWVATIDQVTVANGDPASSAVTESFGSVTESSLVQVLASNGEDSGGGIDGGVPISVSPAQMGLIGLLGLATIGLAVFGATRLRKIGPRRAITD